MSFLNRLKRKKTFTASSVDWLVVGLGNPGIKYTQTRHNIGFMLVDALAGSVQWQDKFKGKCFLKKSEAETVLYLKPQTFMNLSGKSVQAAMQFYKLKPQQVIVIHDELDLPLGKVRVKRGGGAGGHNGLKSIDSAIGRQYLRLRLGISRPPEFIPTADYVLQDFTTDEKTQAHRILQACAEHFPYLYDGKESEFMNKVSLSLIPK